MPQCRYTFESRLIGAIGILVPFSSTEGRCGRIVSDDGASPSGSGGASVLVEEPAEDVTTFAAVTWVAGDSRHSSDI